MDRPRPLIAALDIVLPTRCPACGRTGAAPCASCCSAMAAAPPVPVRAPLASCAAVVHYSGPARRLVTAAKYARHRDGWVSLGGWIAEVAPVGADLVCWVPATPERRRRRGVDQAELLARAASVALGVPAIRSLVRRDHRAQAGRDRVQRLAGPEIVAAPGRRSTRRVSGARVLLVDDVVTTGSSLVAAARVLMALGAESVHGRTFAAAGKGPPAPASGAPTLYHRAHAHPSA